MSKQCRQHTKPNLAVIGSTKDIKHIKPWIHSLLWGKSCIFYLHPSILAHSLENTCFLYKHKHSSSCLCRSKLFLFHNTWVHVSHFIQIQHTWSELDILNHGRIWICYKPLLKYLFLKSVNVNIFLTILI